jgi:hypothetical protein
MDVLSQIGNSIHLPQTKIIENFNIYHCIFVTYIFENNKMDLVPNTRATIANKFTSVPKNSSTTEVLL